MQSLSKLFIYPTLYLLNARHGCLLNEVFNLLTGKTWQYHAGHLWRVNLLDGVFLDVTLPVKPVAEGSDGAVVGILTVVACEVR